MTITTSRITCPRCEGVSFPRSEGRHPQCDFCEGERTIVHERRVVYDRRMSRKMIEGMIAKNREDLREEYRPLVERLLAAKQED